MRHPLALTIILAALTACTLPVSQRAEPALLLAADDPPPEGIVVAAAGHTCTLAVQIDGKPRRMNCSELAAYMPTPGGATSTPLPATPTPEASLTPIPAPVMTPTMTASVPTATPLSTATSEPVPATVTLVPVTVTPQVQTDAAKWGIPAYPEVRAENTQANATRGRPISASLLNQNDAYQKDYLSRVDGNFIGTTEQILEWAARKWFPDQDPDVFKAQAVKESAWNQAGTGDFEEGSYQSFGILQTKMYYWCPNGHHGETPMAGCDQVHTSTAFAADVAAAVMRAHYDGALYTGETAAWNTYPIQPSVSNPTRFRRAVNSWFAGSGSTDGGTDGAGSEYVSIILGGKVNDPGAQLHGQTLSGELADKRWKRGGF